MCIGYQEYTFFPLQTRTATHFTNAVQFSHLDFKRLRNMAKVLPSFQYNLIVHEKNMIVPVDKRATYEKVK